ncbi:MAG: hypothetical protein E7140_01580 [Rikenellaceae bacterium]|nr:hypothetical protein [Rikenellaceae bacterium]
MSIVIEVIAEHLRSNRRLVVPAFGAFVVKETGERLFSDLLNTDDGVLASLLRAKGLSEMEAAVSIDRFIFEVRHELEQYGYCRLGEVGTLRIEPSTKVLRLYPPVEQVELPKQTPYIPKQDERRETRDERNAEPTLRSEGRGCLHTMPGREEEKPSKEGLMQNAECEKQNAECEITSNASNASNASNTSNASAPAHRKPVKPRKKVDFVMVVAVIILLAALAGIGYGWYVANLGIEDDDAAMDALRITPEQIVNE